MIAIIDGCGSNIASIQFALNRLAIKSILTNNKQVIQSASQVVIPGVSSAKIAMQNLKKLDLIDCIKNLTQPVLGICSGMQILYDYSEEGSTECLGIIPGKIYKLLGNQTQKVPHIGWNKINSKNYAYFVHSYCAPISEYTVGITEYTEKFTSIVKYKNFIGMQFHPEKSAQYGEELLRSLLCA